MGTEAVQRNLGMLYQRVAGSTLQEIADDHGVTPQTVHVIVDRTGRRHVEDVLLQMWLAQKQDTLLVLAVPPGLAEEQTAAIAYLDWLLHEFAELGEEVTVHHRPTLTGAIAFALEDRRLTELMKESA
jgi:hypothetical protein